jgi:hypothetical protein
MRCDAALTTKSLFQRPNLSRCPTEALHLLTGWSSYFSFFSRVGWNRACASRPAGSPDPRAGALSRASRYCPPLCVFGQPPFALCPLPVGRLSGFWPAAAPRLDSPLNSQENSEFGPLVLQDPRKHGERQLVFGGAVSSQPGELWPQPSSTHAAHANLVVDVPV